MNSIGNASINTSPQNYQRENYSKLRFDFVVVAFNLLLLGSNPADTCAKCVTLLVWAF